MVRVRRRVVGAAWATLLCVVVVGAGCGGRGQAEATPQPMELTPTQHMRKAQSMLNVGRTQDAVREVEAAIQQEPENARFHSFLGQLYFGAGRYVDAEGAFKHALELDPYLTDARNYLGVVYLQMKRYADAEQTLRKALEDPGYPSPELVYLNLGLLYVSQGRDLDAVEMLRRSVAINPQYYKAHYELAVALERSNQLDEAAREYEVAGPGFENDGEYHYRRGLVYFKLGRADEARASLARVLSVAPGSPAAAQADELLKVIR